MEEKKAYHRMLLFLGGGLLATAVLIYCVDPFYHYHDPWFGIPPILEDAVYQTPGAAKNLPYDSAIVGTSMTENFHTSWFDGELGWHTLKLSYSGARTDDLRAILEKIYERKESPEHIVMDICAYQLTEESWTSFAPRPDYLYDEDPVNDVQYLYNHDVAVSAVNRVIDAFLGNGSNIDSAYTWEQEEAFGRQQTLDSCRDTRIQLLQAQGNIEQIPFAEKLQICQQNLDNIMPYIEQHPETEFIVFIPPYSMLYWEQEKLKGSMEDMLRLYSYCMFRFLQYENVTLYYFQDVLDITANPDNYRDNVHYRPEFNRYIFECIRDGKNRVTAETYQERIENMRRIANEFNYDALWES